MTFLSCGGSPAVIVHAWPVLPDCFLEVPAGCAGNREGRLSKEAAVGSAQVPPEPPGSGRGITLSVSVKKPPDQAHGPEESMAGSATVNTGRWLAPPPGRGGLHQLHLNGTQSPALMPGPCPQVPGWRGRGHPRASTPRPVARTEEHTKQRRHNFTVLSPAAPCTPGPHSPDCSQGQGPRQSR